MTGMSTCLYGMLLWCVKIISVMYLLFGFYLIARHGFLWSFGDWQGGTNTVHYCVSHAVPCDGNFSLVICLYLIAQQEDGDISSNLFNSTMIYKGFLIIISSKWVLLRLFITWPFWDWHKGTSNVPYYVSLVVPCNGKLSLIIDLVPSTSFS